MDRRLHVIGRPSPALRSILVRTGEGDLLLLGPKVSEPALCCGVCGAVLVQGIPADFIVDLVLDCHTCAAHNLTPYSNLRHWQGVPVTVMTFAHGAHALAQPVWWQRGTLLTSKRAVQGMEIAYRTEFRG